MLLWRRGETTLPNLGLTPQQLFFRSYAQVGGSHLPPWLAPCQINALLVKLKESLPPDMHFPKCSHHCHRCSFIHVPLGPSFHVITNSSAKFSMSFKKLTKKSLLSNELNFTPLLFLLLKIQTHEKQVLTDCL